MAKKIEPPFVRNPFNYDTVEASNASSLECRDEHKTQQQFAEESDINFIADRYGLTGELPTILEAPSFSDYSEIFDFQTANNIIVKAKNDFMQLPAKIRTRFQNDPQQYLTFMEDPENTDEAIKLGLANKRPETPQSLQGDAGTKAGGDTPSQPAKAPAAPAKPSPTTDTK